MQGLQESENGAILEYITNQRLVENHCTLSAEGLGVRERVRRILLNWAVHFPVKGCLQEEWAEKRDGGRFVKGRLDEGAQKKMVEDNEGMYWRRDPKRDGGK